VDDALQVLVTPFGKHAQPRLAVVVDTGDELAHHRAVEQRFVLEIPVAPARIVRIGAMVEDLVAQRHQIARSAIIFLVSAIALAGLRPLGQTFAQFMMVWQR